jgi:tight adherence protein B
MILVLIAVFLATLALLLGGYVLVNRRTLEAAEMARSRLRAVDAPGERTRALLKDDKISDVPFLNQLLSGRTWVEGIASQLDRAGLSLRPSAFVLIVGASAILGVLLGLRIGSLGGVFIMVVGIAGPWFWLTRRQKKRLNQFEAQLPDAIDMLVSAMRAGYSFQAATQFIGEEMIQPLGPEFGRFFDEQRLGIDVRTALVNMQSRIDSLDFKMFVTAVLIQRETGGNLSEVLTNLSDIIRQRLTMKSQIQTLIAEPKLSARFLAVLPVIVFGILSVTRPHFFDPMIAPGSVGRLVLIGSAISVLFGYMIMMKIADVDI